MDGSPIGFDVTTMALLRPGVGEQPRLKHRIGHLFRQRPTQAGRMETFKRRPHGRGSHSDPPSDLTGRYMTYELQPKNFAHMAHGDPLCWHSVPPWKTKERT